MTTRRKRKAKRGPSATEKRLRHQCEILRTDLSAAERHAVAEFKRGRQRGVLAVMGAFFKHANAGEAILFGQILLGNSGPHDPAETELRDKALARLRGMIERSGIGGCDLPATMVHDL